MPGPQVFTSLLIACFQMFTFLLGLNSSVFAKAFQQLCASPSFMHDLLMSGTYPWIGDVLSSVSASHRFFLHDVGKLGAAALLSC